MEVGWGLGVQVGWGLEVQVGAGDLHEREIIKSGKVDFGKSGFRALAPAPPPTFKIFEYLFSIGGIWGGQKITMTLKPLSRFL